MFIGSKNFTANNLKSFEIELNQSLKTFMTQEGCIDLLGRINETSRFAGAYKSMERPPAGPGHTKTATMSPNKSAMAMQKLNGS